MVLSVIVLLGNNLRLKIFFFKKRGVELAFFSNGLWADEILYINLVDFVPLVYRRLEPKRSRSRIFLLHTCP